MRGRLGVGALLIVALVWGCRGTPNGPSGGSPTGTPVLSSLSPSQPSLSAAAQLLAITGTEFSTGMSATITKPNGQVIAIGTADFRSFTSTSFQISLVLDIQGSYQLQVKNPNGLTSAPLTFTVGPAVQGALTLISVTPSTALSGQQPQTLFVSGTNFDSTLELDVMAPNSAIGVYGAGLLRTLSSTSFSVDVLLDQAGTYSLVVRNGASATSNALTVSVQRP